MNRHARSWPRLEGSESGRELDYILIGAAESFLHESKFNLPCVEISKPGASPKIKRQARLGPDLGWLSNLAVRSGLGLVRRFMPRHSQG